MNLTLYSLLNTKTRSKHWKKKRLKTKQNKEPYSCVILFANVRNARATTLVHVKVLRNLEKVLSQNFGICLQGTHSVFQNELFLLFSHNCIECSIQFHIPIAGSVSEGIQPGVYHDMVECWVISTATNVTLWEGLKNLSPHSLARQIVDRFFVWYKLLGVHPLHAI